MRFVSPSDTAGSLEQGTGERPTIISDRWLFMASSWRRCSLRVSSRLCGSSRCSSLDHRSGASVREGILSSHRRALHLTLRPRSFASTCSRPASRSETHVGSYDGFYTVFLRRGARIHVPRVVSFLLSPTVVHEIRTWCVLPAHCLREKWTPGTISHTDTSPATWRSCTSSWTAQKTGR